jgi:hypothetical protein
MQPVGAEATAGLGWLTNPCDDEPDAVTGEERLELVDVARTERALGEDDDLDGTLLVPRRLEHPVNQVQVQQLPWGLLCRATRPDRLRRDPVPGCVDVGVLDADVARQ